MINRHQIATFTLALALAAFSAQAGTILGKFVVTGDVPDKPAQAVSKEQLIKFKRSLIVSAKGGVANAVVSLEGASGGGETSAKKSVMDQKEETFVPHVLAVAKGSEVQFLNSDAIMHNLHSYQGGETYFNRAMPAFIKETSKTFENSGVVRVNCDVHAHMQAYIHVFDHPFFAVTNEEGLFVIRNVPDGTFDIVLWHERLETPIKKKVSVSGEDKVPIIFELSPDSL